MKLTLKDDIFTETRASGNNKVKMICMYKKFGEFCINLHLKFGSYGTIIYFLSRICRRFKNDSNISSNILISVLTLNARESLILHTGSGATRH